MNFNFKFENVTVEKKLGATTFAILFCIIFASIAVTVFAFKLAEDKNLYDTQTKAELFAATLSEEMKETVKSVEFISTLASDENLENILTPEKITALLNKTIDSSSKISGAFIMLGNDDISSLADNKVIEMINEDSLDELEGLEELENLEDSDESVDDLNEDKNTLTQSNVNENIVKEYFVDSTNKLVYKIGDVRYETTLHRLENIEYKKNYMKVLTTKKPQMMLPFETDYGNAKITTCTYTVPIMRDGIVDGIFGIDIDIEKLNKEFDEIKYHTNETHMILDREGLVITSNNDAFFNRNVKDIFNGKVNEKILTFVNSTLQSGVSKLYKHQITGLFEDEVYITCPIIIGEEHAWNLLTIARVNKVVISSIGIILFAIILNLVAFALFVFFLWSSIGRTTKKQMNKMLEDVENKLKTIQKISEGIDFDKVSKLGTIEKKGITDTDNGKENKKKKKEKQTENVSGNQELEGSSGIDNDAVIEMIEADEKLEKILEKTDLEKYDSAAEESLNAQIEEGLDSAKTSETLEENNENNQPVAESKEIEESNAITDVQDEANETIRLDENKEEKIYDNAEEIEAEVHTEAETEMITSQDEQIEQNNADDDLKVKIDLDNPVVDENGKKLSAIDQLVDQDSFADSLESDLDDIFANKSGVVEDDSLLKEAEEKMINAMGADSNNEIKNEDEQVENEVEEKVEPMTETNEEVKTEDLKAVEAAAAAILASQASNVSAAVNATNTEKAVKESEVKAEDKKAERPPRRGGKLSSKDMDELLKELEKKRKAENEALGIEEEITNEFSNETTLDMSSIQDMVDKISAK